MNIGKVFRHTYSTLIHRAKLTISHNCSNYKTSESQASVFSLSMIGNKSFMAQEAIHCKMFCTYKLLKRLIPDKSWIEVSARTRLIDQCMKPAVKILHQIFRCKQRIIRPQESQKLPSLLFPALEVEFFFALEIRTIRRFIATELESIDSPIMLCEPCPTTTGTFNNIIGMSFSLLKSLLCPWKNINTNNTVIQSDAFPYIAVI